MEKKNVAQGGEVSSDSSMKVSSKSKTRFHPFNQKDKGFI